jgi:hypothetical protein
MDYVAGVQPTPADGVGWVEQPLAVSADAIASRSGEPARTRRRAGVGVGDPVAIGPGRLVDGDKERSISYGTVVWLCVHQSVAFCTPSLHELSVWVVYPLIKRRRTPQGMFDSSDRWS